MASKSKHRVIVAVLNWGLGHATRSEPVIEKLMAHGYTPVLASDGLALKYLKMAFPSLETERLPAYRISYSKNFFWLKMASQLPRIAWVYRKEHRQLEKLVEKYAAVGVISDNRLGCYSKKVPSAYITHQLKIMLPMGRKLASRLHHRFIDRFSQCWVPDWLGEPNLSGELSHDYIPEVPLRYIGPLSRFDHYRIPQRKEDFDYCVLLSGPEPQRSQLEEMLLHGLSKTRRKVVFIRGTQKPARLNFPERWTVIDLADKDAVARLVTSAKMTISRSGYSSIMDFSFLGNKALLIPTPNQPEQLYLARFLTHTGRFLYAEQKYIELQKNLKEAEEYRGAGDIPKGLVNWEQLLSLFKREAKG